MQKSSVSSEAKTHRASLFVLYLIGGLLVFLLLAVFLRKSARLRKYWEIAFALFIASFARYCWRTWAS